jgi:antitoxin component of MazEF toxin-antitoxin module
MLKVKAGKSDFITFPRKLISELGLREGEKVRVNRKKGVVIIAREKEDFLALEGSLNNADVEKSIKELSKDWQAWKPLESL